MAVGEGALFTCLLLFTHWVSQGRYSLIQIGGLAIKKQNGSIVNSTHTKNEMKSVKVFADHKIGTKCVSPCAIAKMQIEMMRTVSLFGKKMKHLVINSTNTD